MDFSWLANGIFFFRNYPDPGAKGSSGYYMKFVLATSKTTWCLQHIRKWLILETDVFNANSLVTEKKTLSYRA